MSIRHRPPRPLAWSFPAPSTHNGVPLGNGLFGALAWGGDDILRLTINRGDYWDRRGGAAFGPEATYANLCAWLEVGDEANVRRVFEGAGTARPGEPLEPSRLPMGRVDLALPGQTLQCGDLDPAAGVAHVTAGGAAPSEIELVVPRGRALLAARLTGPAAATVTGRSCPPDAPEVRAYWEAYGLPPAAVDDGPSAGGWTQELPAGPDLAVAWRLVPAADGATELYVVAAYGATPDAARAAVAAQLDWAQGQGYARLAAAEAAWWRRYWLDAAYLELPDAGLQELYDLGMYKLAGVSWPAPEADEHAEAARDGMPVWPAATLQGPWVEEYRLPPWSADYHFNINVQECCWPAYSGNQLAALQPLWDLLRGWLPVLRANARLFLGIEDGLMLNHAVDDRGVPVGGWWTGSIDHGSTAWVSQLMWQYYRYTLDEAFLRETAYPFMKGAMRVYEVMLERAPDGSYHLPISVSPEYEENAMWAWGRDASFQLACIHWLAGALVQAAEILGCDPAAADQWQDILAYTPRGCIGGDPERPELLVWAGQPLAHSHRHHSHLAGIYPFDVWDPWGDAGDAALLHNSAATWTRQGMGEWAAWGVAWAAILRARLHQGARAALLLNEFRHTFRMVGRASTHDAVHPGFTVLDTRTKVMQVDASLCAAAAIMEMLVHTTRGVLYLFPAVPDEWQTVRFDGIRVEGAFMVAAAREDGRTRWVQVRSLGQSRLRMAPPCPGVDLAIDGNRLATPLHWPADAILEREMEPGEEIYVTVS